MDINKQQRLASDPFSSVWVSASAGSGKTKVLTDRVLNLLLLSGNPEKILCLTYTKAAASEMSNRINKILKQWAICSESELASSLETLTGEVPDTEQLTRARRLFASVLETPGGMKIMTIHGFCQTILKRFPLEAGIPPDFDIIDDAKSDTILNDTLISVLNTADFQNDVEKLAQFQTPDDLIELFKNLFSHRGKLLKLREKNSLDTLISQIKTTLNITQYNTEEDIISDFFNPDEWPDIKKRYLKKDGTVQKKKEKEEDAQTAETVMQGIKNLKLVQLTHSLLRLAYTVLEHYQNQKQSLGLLDFDDLIGATKNLLAHSHAAAWVLFKLDGGIDHILVDEAQDSNADQWAIIRMLTEEFFAGLDHHETLRTIFAVGDKKQSIYRFQGAAPDEFEHMRQFFKQKIQESENEFRTVPFNLSFRSTRPVLELVNKVLENPIAHQGVIIENEDAYHLAYREKDAGLVEIWPLEQHLKTDTEPAWKPPVEQEKNRSALSRLAERIADKITHMIRSGDILESQGRPVQAGDFLILVQRRNYFVNELVRFLKDRQIPVAGIDRINLSQHIAVQDLMAAAKFALLPEDDLNLACLLKSPLIGLNEDDLFKAAYNRGSKSLWQRVQALFPVQAEKLKQISNNADKIKPFEFFASILGASGGKKAFLSRLGNEAVEAIEEFLNRVLTFEQSETPSLQKFIDLTETRDMEIKRDMESGLNAVRIMTVHASKGLQGNIVFLPQTRFISRKREPFLWLNGELPLWLPNQSLSTLFTDELIQYEDAKDDEENRRLLYVALTRASDRLYICGYENAKPAQDNNWYDLIVNSLQDYTPDSDGIIRIRSKQLRPVDKTQSKTIQQKMTLPDWAYRPAPEEPTPSKPLTPSKPTNEEPAPDSPLDKAQSFALERGKFIHKLLQFLPQFSPDEWPTVIKRLKPEQIDLPNNLTDLLTAERFRLIFGKDSLAEVPVVGVWEGKAVSGQIDRLVITDKEVWIIDFKTNRHIPSEEDNIPKLYREQLNAYHGLISQIFSDKVIRTYLLWTENLTLMEIKNEN
jgi:ATP-dependent helicase/nuclease subunit A